MKKLLLIFVLLMSFSLVSAWNFETITSGSQTISIITNGTDTNETVRFGTLAGTDCGGTDKMVGGSGGNTTVEIQAAETDTNWLTNFTNMQVDCPGGNYSYGIFNNGTFKCRDDEQGSGSSGGNTTNEIIIAINNTDGTFNITVNVSISWGNNAQQNTTQFETEPDGTFSLLFSWFSSTFDTLFGLKDTDDLTEGSVNIYEQFNWAGNYSIVANTSTTYNQTTIDANILSNASADGAPTFVGTNYSTNLNTSNG